MWSRLVSLIYKEILAIWKDKKSRFVLIAPPLLQLCVFSMAATLDVKNATIGILNRDYGEQGFEFVQRFHGSPRFFKHIIYLKGVEEIAPFLNEQKGIMVISIDELFSRNLDAKKPATVQLILDGRKSNTAQIVAGYATAVINHYSEDIAPRIQTAAGSIRLIPRNWFNPNLLYPWFTVPALLGTLTMIVALMVTSLSIARERELGTFDQLLVSPLRPGEIILGKGIPALLFSQIEGSFLMIAAIFFFQIPFTGSFLFLYLSLFVFICAIIGIGLSISSLCSTQQQAILGAFTFTTPAVLLSGFATPIENMPHWLQFVTYLNPLRYFLVICRGVFLKELPIEIILQNIWPLALIALLTLSTASFFFRRHME